MGLLFLAVVVTACKPTQPSTNVFAAAHVAVDAQPEAVAEVAEVAETDAGKSESPASGPAFDFDANDRPKPVDNDEADESLSTEPLASAPAMAEPPPVDPVDELTDAPAVSAPRVGAHAHARAIAILADLHPPRAILRLRDGSEHVVRPGTMLPDAQLVILDITADAIQLATLAEQGSYGLELDRQTLRVAPPP